MNVTKYFFPELEVCGKTLIKIYETDLYCDESRRGHDAMD